MQLPLNAEQKGRHERDHSYKEQPKPLLLLSSAFSIENNRLRKSDHQLPGTQGLDGFFCQVFELRLATLHTFIYSIHLYSFYTQTA